MMAFCLRVTLAVLAMIGLTSAGCPPLWTRYGNNCYRFLGHEMSWTDAEHHCQEIFSVSGQGHLASMHSPGEANFLIQYAKSSFVSAQGKHVWIGLSDQSSEGIFAWSDGSAVDYLDWPLGQPDDDGGNEDCGEIFFLAHGAIFNDQTCSSRHSHICQMPVANGC